MNSEGDCMARLFPLLAILVLHAFAAQARDVYYQGDLAPRNITPTFDKGYLAVYETLETISLYGPDGALAYKATAHVPGASWLDVENAAPDSDGTLVVTLEYRVSNVRRWTGSLRPRGHANRVHRYGLRLVADACLHWARPHDLDHWLEGSERAQIPRGRLLRPAELLARWAAAGRVHAEIVF
jgi:hypothetical protein